MGLRVQAGFKGVLTWRAIPSKSCDKEWKICSKYCPRILTIVLVAVATAGSLLGDIAYPSGLEINMGPMTFAVYSGGQWATWYDYAHYDSQHPVIYSNCGTGQPGSVSVRTCFQQILAKYKTQNISGVRFMFELDDVLDSNNAIISYWMTGLNNFFADLYSAGIYNVTPTSGFIRGTRIVKTNVTAGCGWAPVPVMQFWRTAPFGERCTSPGYGCDFDGNLQSYAHACSPKTPDDIFVGWPKIVGPGGIIDSILQAAQTNHLTVEEWDMQNEINLGVYTVYARLMVDPTRGNYDVLTQVRQLMSNHGFDSHGVTYSSAGNHCTNAAGCAGNQCYSIYGDPSRVFDAEQTIAGIAGGLIGQVTGFSAPCGLVCGGSTLYMYQMPIGHSTPNIVDIHNAPCLLGSGSCDTTQWPTVAGEATADFNAFAIWQATYAPGGWRYQCCGYDPNMANAVLMLGETHGHAQPRNISDPWCLDDQGVLWDPRATDYTVNGFNASSLNGRQLPNGPGWVVFRPWEYLEYLGPNPVLCNPIYVNPPYRSSN